MAINNSTLEFKKNFIEDKPLLLLIDDEVAILQTLKASLEDENFRVETLADGNKALDLIGKLVPDLILLDIFMPNCNGIELLEKIKREYPAQKVIISSGFGTIAIALEAVRKGAIDFIEKPLNLDEILAKLSFLHPTKQTEANAPDSEKQTNPISHSDWLRFGIVGQSYLFQELMHQVTHIAKLDFPVLLYGPHGSGKTLLANYMHAKSKLVDKNFTIINCAAHEILPLNCFDRAGTLLLKNIDQLSLTEQKKVLNFFESDLAKRGNSKNLRIIATSAANIFKMTQENTFNPLLFNKLNITPLEITGLNKRRYDIPLLISYFLEQANQVHSKSIELPAQSIRNLRNHDWRGNVTQLKACIEKMVALTPHDNQTVTPELLQDFLEETDTQFIEEQAFLRFNSLQEASSAFEKKFLLYLLKKNRYDLHQTCEQLHVSIPLLRDKMSQLNINLTR